MKEGAGKRVLQQPRITPNQEITQDQGGRHTKQLASKNTNKRVHAKDEPACTRSHTRACKGWLSMSTTVTIWVASSMR
jgi:hypothetical protein